jgi:Uma2 family endonuclease
MATATRLSLEEFHRIYDGVKPNHEYWFGEAVAKPMATYLHGIFQGIMLALLLRRGWRAATEVTLKMSQDLELVPDVIATRAKVEGAYPTQPVDICVEILSPDDRLKTAIEKGKTYLDWGVEYIWIISPVERAAWMVTHEHPNGIWVKPDGNLTAGKDTEIPLPELFAEVDKVLGS